jgi:hypothetical protein
MKIVLSLLGLLIMTSAIGTPAPAYAQNYPWCAYYSGRGFGGATNCGFTSFQQCMATVSGIGGFCQLNNMYVPPPGSHRRSRPYRYPY